MTCFPYETNFPLKNLLEIQFGFFFRRFSIEERFLSKSGLGKENSGLKYGISDWNTEIYVTLNLFLNLTVYGATVVFLRFS